MIIEHFYCDHCGTEVHNANNLNYVEYKIFYAGTPVTASLCHECFEKVHSVVSEIMGKKIDPKDIKWKG